MFVYCNMEKISGHPRPGWITIQKRMNGKMDFRREMKDYMEGFGMPDEDLWLGLQNMHHLSRQYTSVSDDGRVVTKAPKLIISFEDWEGVRSEARYQSFGVAGKAEGYRVIDLQVATDNTFPNPSDIFSEQRFQVPASDTCYPGKNTGWWGASSCSLTNLNGKLASKMQDASHKVAFVTGWQNNAALKYIDMKIQYEL